MIAYAISALIWAGFLITYLDASLACVTNPCLYGICIEASNHLLRSSSSYTCYCIDGYTGAHCQTNWDECWSAPCLNGGTCTDGIAAFNCTCPEGFVGETCEENVNECGSNPCLNNGTCIDVANGYTCSCSPGYSGMHCELDLAVCNTTEETRCNNGGTCIEGPGITFTCRCLPGWAGSLCDSPVDECSSAPCENGGVCIDMHAMYVCACPYGYTGMNCETQVELCLTNTCENRALCVIEGKTSVCYCVPDFHGDHCQYRYDECQKGPGCLNGATCVDGVDSYTCSCVAGFTGRFCECQIRADDSLNCNLLFTTKAVVTQSTNKPGGATVASTTLLLPFNSSQSNTFTSIRTTYSLPQEDFTTSSVQTDFSTFPSVSEEQSASTLREDISGTSEITTETTVEDVTLLSTLPVTSYEESSLASTSSVFTSMIHSNAESQTYETESIFPTSSSSTDTIHQRNSTMEFVTVYSTISESTTWLTGTTPAISLFTEMESPFDRSTASTMTSEKTFKPSTHWLPVDWSFSTPQSVFRPSSEETPILTDVGFDCFNARCFNGGSCRNTTQGPRCLCNFGWKGKFCEEEEGIIIAAFRGHSYLLHFFGNSSRTAVSFKIRTLAENGILLYAHVSSSVYMVLYLQQGFLRFQFSCGVQSMLFSELKYSINTGYEMLVSASLDLEDDNGIYHHCNGRVKLNGTLSMNGKQEADLPFFERKLSSALYLGGLSSQLQSKVDLPVKRGIVACMFSLSINNKSREIYGEAFDGFDITECNSLPCLSSPCHNAGTCIDIGHKWSCLCTSGYLGKTCERSVCANNPCKSGGTCVEYPGSGFLCLCPLGKHGMFCDQDLEIGHPQFSSSVGGLSSFIAYPLPGPIHHSFEIHFRFQPSNLDQISLMVFIGQGHPHDSSSDHLAVSFIKGYVVLTWNLGSGPRRIFTPQSLAETGKDVHLVKLGRSGQLAWLQVDSMSNVTGTSPGRLSQLNTRPVIFLGGHDSHNFTGLPHDLPLHTGFAGCLYDIELRTGKVHLQIQRTRNAFGRNVGQCLTKQCHNMTCLNQGACMDHGATYACLCQEGWFSPGCAMRYNPCDSSRHNCSDGSTCVPASTGYECDCPLGKSGRYCEKDETLSDVGFTGRRSYLSLPPAALDLAETCIDVEIRPTSSHGIILFAVQRSGPSISFVSLSLHGGVIEFRILAAGGHRGNEDVLIVRSARVVALSQWTRVRAGRYGRRIYVWVDGTVNSGDLLPGESLLPSDSPLYIGGTEDLSTLPPGAVAGLPVSFSGCMRRLWLNWRSLPLEEQFIISARNIHDCDGTACGGDFCVNGGSCWITPDNKPVCTCLDRYHGDRCENIVSCLEVGCKHNGRCIEHDKSRLCVCAIGWNGYFCDEEVGQGPPHFSGNSYLVVDAKRILAKREEEQSLPRKSAHLSKASDETSVSYLFVNFSTAQQDGMLLWTSKNDHFLGFGVEMGMTKVVWGNSALDKNEFLLPGTAVADGDWHTLTISRFGQNIHFWSDRSVTQSYSTDTPFTSDGIFYVGGFPGERLVEEETGGSFHNSFNGCVREIIINDYNSIVDFSEYEGGNLKSCDAMYP